MDAKLFPARTFPMITEEAVRTLASEGCGVLRSGEGLRAVLEKLRVPRENKPDPTRTDFQTANMLTVAELIAACALAREESRGGHYRLDFPDKREEFRKHSSTIVNRGVWFR